MAQERYNLFDTFEYRGKWWLPENPENKVGGNLVVTKDKMVLDLFGSLRGDDLSKHLGSGEVFNPNIINGITDDGTLCTLKDNYLRGSNISLSSVVIIRESYIVNILFIGQLFTSIEDIKFKSVSVNYSLLEEWLSKEVFKNDISRKGKLFEAQSQFNFPESFEVFISSIDALISLDGHFNTGGDGFRTLIWNYMAFLKITPNKDRDFDWFVEQLHSLASMLTLFTGEPIYPRRIKAQIGSQNKTTENQIKEPIEILYKPIGTESPKSLHPLEMILPFSLVRENISNVISNWFEKSNLLKPTVNIFISIFYKSKIYIDNVFLSLMHATESFLRKIYGGQYIPEQEYSQYLNQIVLPVAMPSELKESLRKRLEYGNEYSLRKRFEKLFDILESKLKNLITDNTDAFITSVVDTRNYLTHYDKKLEEKCLHGADLYYTNQRLALLLTIVLLKEIGISEDIIHQQILQTKRFAGLLQKG